jgi:hypothetical protein
MRSLSQTSACISCTPHVCFNARPPHRSRFYHLNEKLQRSVKKEYKPWDLCCVISSFLSWARNKFPTLINRSRYSVVKQTTYHCIFSSAGTLLILWLFIGGFNLRGYVASSRIGRWPWTLTLRKLVAIWRYCRRICMEGLRKNTKNYHQNSR